MAIRNYKKKTPLLGNNVFVDDAAVVIGDVHLGDDSSVWPCAVIRGDMHSIKIGKRTNIQDGCVLHITHASSYNPDGFPLEIGDNVTIGHNVTLHGCKINDQVLIGMGAVVLDGAVIESQVLVAAGAVVPPGSFLKSGFLYKGNPAQQGRPLTNDEKLFFLYSANNYVELKNHYLNDNN